MILVDANLLVYAHGASMPEHARARGWLDEKLSGPSRVGLPWQSLLTFLRLVTNPRIFRNAESLSSAWKKIDEWMSSDAAWMPEPTGRHADILKGLLALPGLNANDVPDAHLAALAIEHGLTLCSSDRGFARFSGLNWLNPLA